MKRTRTLTLTSLMAMGGVSLTACGDQPSVTISEPKTDAYAYQSLQECKAKNEVPDEACDTAMKATQDEQNADARYADNKTCEDVYGPGQCVPRSQAGGGSIWGPLATGFIVGQMMNGGWGGGGMYRDYRSGGYYSRGGPISTDYASGRTQVSQKSFDSPAATPPAKAMTRTSVVSRGGFGGRMSSRSSGGWGG